MLLAKLIRVKPGGDEALGPAMPIRSLAPNVQLEKDKDRSGLLRPG